MADTAAPDCVSLAPEAPDPEPPHDVKTTASAMRMAPTGYPARELIIRPSRNKNHILTSTATGSTMDIPFPKEPGRPPPMPTTVRTGHTLSSHVRGRAGGNLNHDQTVSPVSSTGEASSSRSAGRSGVGVFATRGLPYRSAS